MVLREREQEYSTYRRRQSAASAAVTESQPGAGGPAAKRSTPAGGCGTKKALRSRNTTQCREVP